MNVSDSEWIEGILQAWQMEESSLEEADLILLNTCSVRDRAEQKVRSFLGELKKEKARRPDLIVGVVGCMAKRAYDYLQTLSFLDFTLGPEELASFPDKLKEVARERGFLLGDLPQKIKPRRKSPTSAYVVISYGCDNFCSYCVVPYLRGREKSRNPKEIISEIKELASCDFKEVILLGQNVNSYRYEDWDFSKLLEEIHKMEGIRRIRYLTSHPRDFNEALVLRITSLPKVCEHFHLPLQSGSNKVLDSMNRGYSRESYLKLVSFINQEMPQAAITTDIIVGYPEEGEEEFLQTVDLMEKVQFDSAYILTYSPRPGTAAFPRGDPVPNKEKLRRLYFLQDLAKEHALKRNKALQGKHLEVLVEGKDPKGNLVGRTRSNKEVIFEGPNELIGSFLEVKIEEVTPWSLRGKL